MTEIERLARIDYQAIGDELSRATMDGRPWRAWEDADEGSRDCYRAGVRAILQAMREPSEGMLAQMRLTRPNGEMQPAYLAPAIWQAGIDHILSEAP